MRVKAITVRAYTSLASEISLADAFARAQAGEKEGFEQLYLHYQPIYENQLRRLVDEREVVQELCQEAFINAWRALSKKQSLSHFEKSLSRSATNLAIDYLRRKKFLAFDPLPENETDDPQEYMLSRQISISSHETAICEMDCLIEILGKLSHQYRVCVILQEVWGYSQREIAQILGISESTVSANVSRGMRKIRKAYHQMSRDHQGGDRSNEK